MTAHQRSVSSSKNNRFPSTRSPSIWMGNSLEANHEHDGKANEWDASVGCMFSFCLISGLCVCPPFFLFLFAFLPFSLSLSVRASFPPSPLSPPYSTPFSRFDISKLGYTSALKLFLSASSENAKVRPARHDTGKVGKVLPEMHLASGL